MISGVASLSVVLSRLGRIPTEEQLVEAVRKQQKHNRHQQAPRVLAVRRVRALAALLVVVVMLVSREETGDKAPEI